MLNIRDTCFFLQGTTGLLYTKNHHGSGGNVCDYNEDYRSLLDSIHYLVTFRLCVDLSFRLGLYKVSKFQHITLAPSLIRSQLKSLSFRTVLVIGLKTLRTTDEQVTWLKVELSLLSIRFEETLDIFWITH